MSRPCSRRATSRGGEQRFCTDRDEAAAQEGSERGGIAGGDLCPHQRTGVDTPHPLGDQTTTGTATHGGGCRAAKGLDGQFEPVDESPADRDETAVVGVDPNVAPVLTRSQDPRMSVQRIGLGQLAAPRSAGDQHRIVRTDPTGRAGKPADHVGMRRSAETIGSVGEQLGGIPIGQHDRVAGEFHDGVVIAVHRRQDLDQPVDRRKSTDRSGREGLVQWMHRRQDYGRRMRVDVMTFPRSLREMGAVATSTAAAGFDGMLFTEGGRTAYPAVTAAALAAPELEMSTGVAVAFPRSPMITAQVAWELQELTGGHFRLGLGTQVRTHVVRRYGVDFDRPGPRLRDYVLAVKACFAGFRGEPLDHHGEFYDLDFLNRQWSPGPIDVADPKVDVAAVNPWMLRMAGDVADGVHVHPIGEPGYLSRHVLPNLASGTEAAGRAIDEVSVIVPVTTIVGDTDEEISASRDAARLSLSFYGSTPNYAFVWDEAGFEGTTERIRTAQKAGDFAAMAAEITDEHLAVFCTEASWSGLADALIAKYDGTVDRLVFYNPAFDSPERFERYGTVAREISDRTAP